MAVAQRASRPTSRVIVIPHDNHDAGHRPGTRHHACSLVGGYADKGQPCGLTIGESSDPAFLLPHVPTRSGYRLPGRGGSARAGETTTLRLNPEAAERGDSDANSPDERRHAERPLQRSRTPGWPGCLARTKLSNICGSQHPLVGTRRDRLQAENQQIRPMTASFGPITMPGVLVAAQDTVIDPGRSMAEYAPHKRMRPLGLSVVGSRGA